MARGQRAPVFLKGPVPPRVGRWPRLARLRGRLPREISVTLAASAHPRRSKCSSATFMQSRPNGDCLSSSKCKGRHRVRRGRKGAIIGQPPFAARRLGARATLLRPGFANIFPDRCHPLMGGHAVTDGLVGQVAAGELAGIRRRISELIVGHDEDQRQTFDRSLIQSLVK